MRSESYFEMRSCRRKQRLRDAKEANGMKKYVKLNMKKDMQKYACEFCGGYHLTSKK